MPDYKIKLVKKILVADGTMEFLFEKPAGFSFQAGQLGNFTLLNPTETDEEGSSRIFTLVRPPYEKYIGFTTRMRDSAFKRILKDLPLGTEINLDGPYGKFVLHDEVNVPVVFLTGGIGITPARSIVAQATHDSLKHQITLFYFNRTPQLAAFTNDFTDFASQNPNFTFIPVMTETKAPDWNGETGFITQEMLKNYIPDLKKPIYYISGPAAMVASMRKILVEAEVNEDNIKTEEFAGYL